MQLYNDTNKEQSLYHDALWWLDMDEDAFPFVDFVRAANFALDTVRRKIMQTSGRWQHDDWNNTNTIPIDYFDLESGVDNYPLSDAHLKIERVRIKDRNGNFITSTPCDRRDLTDEELSSTGMPRKHDKLGRTLLLTPVPDYSKDEGIEVTYLRGSNYFNIHDTVKEPGFEPMFHRYVSLLPSEEVATKYAPKRLPAIQAKIKELDADLAEFFALRDKDDRPKITLKRNRGVQIL